MISRRFNYTLPQLPIRSESQIFHYQIEDDYCDINKYVLSFHDCKDGINHCLNNLTVKDKLQPERHFKHDNSVMDMNKLQNNELFGWCCHCYNKKIHNSSLNEKYEPMYYEPLFKNQYVPALGGQWSKIALSW